MNCYARKVQVVDTDQAVYQFLSLEEIPDIGAQKCCGICTVGAANGMEVDDALALRTVQAAAPGASAMPLRSNASGRRRSQTWDTPTPSTNGQHAGI